MGHKAAALSGDAVRRGSIYCAPACGGACTQDAFDLATQRAGDLCRQLGKGWKSRVHENMGWHCSAVGVAGHMSVHVNVDGSARTGDSRIRSYTAFLNTTPGVGGRWAESAATPEAAIKKTIALMEAEREELNTLHERLAKGFR